MNLETLRGFWAVCQHGSFTKAANSLFLTQPAVSQQVKSLEGELGIQLFEKRGRELVLTPAGEEVREGAEKVFGQIEQIREAVDDIKGLRRGRINVAASDTVVMYLFPEWLKKFRKSFPKIEVHLAGESSSVVEKMVLRGECDLGLITLPASSPDLICEKFRDEVLCLIIPKNDKLAGKKKVDLKKVIEKPRIALNKGSVTRRIIDKALSERNLDWQPDIELGGYAMIKEYVAAGFGAAIIPKMAVKNREGYIIKNLPRDFPKQELGIIYRKGRYITKPSSSMVEIIWDRA